MAMEIDPYELISSVRVRKLLYDRDDKLYGNRNFSNNAWREVAEEIGTDEISARRKWSGLRDYFTRQYRLVNSGSGQHKKVRWCFYNNLLFLSKYLDPKTVSSLSVKLDYDPACAEDMESASLVNADHIKSQPSSDEDSTPFDALEEQTQTSVCRTRDSSSNNSRRFRRKRTYNSANDNNCDDDVIPGHSSMHFDNSNDGGGGMQQMSSNSYQDSPNHVEEDHDELFLKSLLPDLKCVTDEISKMECKIEIQGVILKFIRVSRSISGAHSNHQTDSSSDAT